MKTPYFLRQPRDSIHITLCILYTNVLKPLKHGKKNWTTASQQKANNKEKVWNKYKYRKTEWLLYTDLVLDINKK